GLLGRGGRGLDRDIGSALQSLAERNGAFGQGEQRVVAAHADVLARPPGGAALTHDDVAGYGRLAAEQLDAQAAPRGIAAVTGRAACFLVCHGSVSSAAGGGFG